MKKKRRLKNNYLNLFLILFGVILLTIGSSNIYINYSNNKVNQSYISKYISNIQPNEIEIASVEFSSDTFIYVSYTGDKKIYDFEVKLKKLLKDKDLTESFIYTDITKLKENKNYLKDLNKILGIEKDGLKELPSVIYFKDSKVVDFIDSKNGHINTGDVSQLLEKYELIN